MTTRKCGDRPMHSNCILLVALLAIGCADATPPANTTSNSEPAPAVRTNSNVVPPLTASTTTSPTQVDGTGGGLQPSAATAPPQAKLASPSPPPNSSLSRIRLSAGVALAQPLPEGTTVMCSMDYEWTQGAAQQGCEYAWVVELGNGQRVAGSANVSKRRGNIQATLHGIKPDRGPFKGAVFVKSPGASPEPISDFVSLN